MIFEIFFGGVSLLVAAVYFVVRQNKRQRIDFLGKHVVITGGTQGIGYELALEAFRQGAHVSVLARNQARLDVVRAELEAIKRQNSVMGSQIIQTESIDIAKNCDETKKIFDKLATNAGPVDILINNAGITKNIEFSNTPAADFENLMRTNYLGSVFCTKAVVESMKARRFGRIMFVSSQAGQVGLFGYTAYSPTKFALRGLAEALQMEMKPHNVYVTVSFPPDTDTPGLQEENLNRVEETRLMSESSGLATSKEIALGMMNDIKKGSFSNYFGLNGFLLACLTCGFSPATTVKEAALQITLIPLTRLVAIFLGFNFDLIVKSCAKKRQAAAK